MGCHSYACNAIMHPYSSDEEPHYFIHQVHPFPNSCSDGYLRIYLKGQETENAYDNPDHEVCGKTLPQTVVSSGPRLVMVFSSGKYQGGRFKAHYKFETGTVIKAI